MSAFSSKENFPTGTATLPFLSSLNSTRPAFTSCTAFAVSSVTVPVLGLGINPRGPSTFPSFRTSAMAVGGDRNIKSLKTLLAFLKHVFHPDKFCARLSGCFRCLALRENEHAHLFAAAMRKGTCPAHHLVRLLWINAKPK